jgi:hypothetical protein
MEHLAQAECHLAQAERYLEAGERHLARQREIIAALERAAKDRPIPVALLKRLWLPQRRPSPSSDQKRSQRATLLLGGRRFVITRIPPSP